MIDIINSPEWDEDLILYAQDIVKKTLSYLNINNYEISLNLSNEEEVRELNKQYRDIDKSTNILSFSINEEYEGVKYLGDLVLDYHVIKAESDKYSKAFKDRYAHILIHGVLHLLGYDHIFDSERAEMEKLEEKILGVFNIKDPYIIND